jgi:hypothetical protein
MVGAEGLAPVRGRREACVQREGGGRCFFLQLGSQPLRGGSKKVFRS